MHRYLVGLSLALAAAFACSPAAAQWMWKDAKGTTVYSDQPPPSDIKPSQIVKQPGAGYMPPSAPAPAAEGKPAKSAAQLDADFRKRQSDKAAAEKKASDQARADQRQAEGCTRARGSLQNLRDGARFRSTSGDGLMSDDERASEIDRLSKQIAESCK